MTQRIERSVHALEVPEIGRSVPARVDGLHDWYDASKQVTMLRLALKLKLVVLCQLAVSPVVCGQNTLSIVRRLGIEACTAKECLKGPDISLHYIYNARTLV